MRSLGCELTVPMLALALVRRLAVKSGLHLRLAVKPGLHLRLAASVAGRS